MADLGDLFDEDAGEASEEEEIVANPRRGKTGGGDENGSKDEGEAVDSSEEEEGAEQNDYDYSDNFLAREDEDEEPGEKGEGGSDAEGHDGRRKRQREELELDEEDYALVEEATGVRRKKSDLKRLRKQKDVSAAEAEQTAEERLKAELFGTDELGVGLEDEMEERQASTRREEAPADDFEDEMAGFIDDDDLEGGRRPKRGQVRGIPGGIDSAALQDAQDIFGDVGDLLAAYAERQKPEDKDVLDELEEEAEEDEDEEAAKQRQSKQEERRRAREERRVAELVEPGVAERHMLTKQDDLIRSTDTPERYQLAQDTPIAQEDYPAAALWILENLVGSASTKRLERDVLEEGRLEVDGGQHEPGALEGDVTDLSFGRRAVQRPRGSEERKAWRASTRDGSTREGLTRSITHVLSEIYGMKHEVPYIALHGRAACGELLSLRKEDLPAWTSRADGQDSRSNYSAGMVQAKHRRIRRWEVLWEVQSLARHWTALQQRKERLQQHVQACLDAAESPTHAEAFQACLTALDDAASMEAVDDVDIKFQLAHSVADVGAEEVLDRRYAKAKRSSAYAALKKLDLEGVVEAMGVSPALFGENLRQGVLVSQPIDPRVTPEEFAIDFCREPLLSTPEDVLDKARKTAITELVAEPGVRVFVRKIVMKNAVVTTEPTAAGKAVLDAFHPYGQVARLRKKPLWAFEGGDQYLRLHLAEKEGLITTVVELEDQETDVVGRMRDLYCSQGGSAVILAWNEQRMAVLRDAVGRLVTAGLGEAILQLTSAAKDVALRRAGDTFWRLARTPPLQVVSNDDEEVIERRRFMAACWGDGQPATVLVMLDPAGNLTDLFYAGSFSGPLRRPPQGYDLFMDPKTAKDAERLREFLVMKMPHTVLVGATNLHARILKDHLSRLQDHILEVDPQVFTRSDTGSIDIRYADETIAAVWADSAAAKAELPDHPPLVRKAVALGRLALQPVAVLASLCEEAGREVLALPLHPMQHALRPDDLLAVAERTMVTAVNQVGVDLNALLAAPWQARMLQFIGGLGPRKAPHLLKAVQRSGPAESRYALWRELQAISNCILRNCGSALRIRASGRGMDNADLEALDDTRIHPLDYKYAYEVARRAVRTSRDAEDSDKIAVERALARPRDVERLDLERYNRELVENGDVDQLSKLVDIAMELIEPYWELRYDARLREPVSEEAAFWMVTGESEETLREGRRVEAVVRWVGSSMARCSLPEFGNLEAILNDNDISSSGRVNPADRVQVGVTLPARIKEVLPSEWRVTLTTTSADLNDDTRWERTYLASADRWYHVLTTEERTQALKEQQRAARKKVVLTRPITHPNWRNVSQQVATDELERAAVGEALLRPSARDPVNSLALSIKAHQGVPNWIIWHTDVREAPKNGLAAHLRLGLPLTIELVSGKFTDTYEDLDELVARFVEPFVSRFRSVAEHRKFKEGEWSEVAAMLRVDFANSQKRSVYCLGLSYDNPGHGYIAFIVPTATARPHREFFTVLPSGFYFQHEVHKSIDRVIRAFQKDFSSRSAPPAPPVLGPADAAMLGYKPPVMQQQQVPAQSAYYPTQAYAYPGQYAGQVPQQAYMQPPPAGYGLPAVPASQRR